MNCLPAHQRSFALPSHFINGHVGSRSAPLLLEMVRGAEFRVSRRTAVKAASPGPMSSADMKGTETEDEKKSEIYSDYMTQAMGAVLTYRHELGMNYDFILPHLIVGSCLQLLDDVDKLRKIDVKTIFCLQQNSNLEYFDINIKAIEDYAKQCGDIEHVHAELRDFDGFDLRMRLPSVVSKLYKAINCDGGVTYIHCTAGLGRAPSVALAAGKRSCFPNLEGLKYATEDILTGLAKRIVILTWHDNQCSSVEVSGLDIGWEQRIPLQFDEDRGIWILDRELPERRYEYKYIIDGEWMCNRYELITDPNKDGHINNYKHVHNLIAELLYHQ